MLTLIIIAAYVIGAALSYSFFLKPMQLSKFESVWFTVLWPIPLFLRLVYFIEKGK